MFGIDESKKYLTKTTWKDKFGGIDIVYFITIVIAIAMSVISIWLEFKPTLGPQYEPITTTVITTTVTTTTLATTTTTTVAPPAPAPGKRAVPSAVARVRLDSAVQGQTPKPSPVQESDPTPNKLSVIPDNAPQLIRKARQATVTPAPIVPYTAIAINIGVVILLITSLIIRIVVICTCEKKLKLLNYAVIVLLLLSSILLMVVLGLTHEALPHFSAWLVSASVVTLPSLITAIFVFVSNMKTEKYERESQQQK